MVVQNTSENRFSKYTFKYSKSWQIVITIGKFQLSSTDFEFFTF